MNRRQLIRAGATATALSSIPHSWAQDKKSPKRRILFFTRSQGFEHSVIKRQGDNPSHAERVLGDLAAQHGFEVTATKDGSVFTADNLAKYDAVFFETTGDLTKPGGDGNNPFPEGGKEALLDAIKNGKGFVGSHCATDTFHTPGERFQSNGDKVDPYIAMIGGEFIRHGAQQIAKMRVVDRTFPGFADQKDFEMHEEWYSLKDFAKDLHVLLVQETEVMKGPDYHRGPFPATWARMHGKGRVFYTSMGHREDVWSSPVFQGILLGGIAWAVGNVKANVKPNLEQAAPRHADIPPKA